MHTVSSRGFLLSAYHGIFPQVLPLWLLLPLLIAVDLIVQLGPIPSQRSAGGDQLTERALIRGGRHMRLRDSYISAIPPPSQHVPLI